MGYQPLENLLPKSDFSNYTLIRMAAQRAQELGNGRKAMVDVPLNQKLATTALEEIMAAKLVVPSVAKQFHPDQLAADKLAADKLLEEDDE